MARLEQAITNIVDVFLEYAGDDGQKPKLSKEELKMVLEKEIHSLEFKVRELKHSHDMHLCMKNDNTLPLVQSLYI